MDETPFSPEDELSAEDLAVIQAFDALDELDLASNQDEFRNNSVPLAFENGGLDIENPEDMLILFASEADEDIGTMRRALQQVEQDNQASSPGLISLGRAAHKLKGTAGAMGCEVMSVIALEIEEEIQLLREGRITFFAGLMALVHATHALELTLQSVVNDGQESTQPLRELRQEMTTLNLEASQVPPSEAEPQVTEQLSPSKEPSESGAGTTIQVDMHYLHALMSHTESLVELHNPLQNAQRQVTQSLVELQAAYSRLRRLEGLFSSVAFTNTQPNDPTRSFDNQPSSSLVARILHEALQRTGRPSQFRPRPPLPIPPGSGRTAEQFLWDEMEMDSFTENRILLQSFSEAVADVATASAQLRSAFAQLNTLIEKQVGQSTIVRNDALRLRSAPFSLLLVRVQRAVQKIAQDHKQPIQFESAGETTEINQDILEVLTEPLLQLIRTSVADSLLALPQLGSQAATATQYHILLQARVIGNEMLLELGFSMPIPGGAVEALREPIQLLQGTIAARRNSTGGISYQMRFPRAQGVIQGLLVQASGQNLVLSLAHVHSIDYKRQQPYAQIYNLVSLLGFPASGVPTATFAPVILLANSSRRIGIQVDEIIGEIEVAMKPLPAHLQRPGVIGAAIDGSGNVLLILDLPALVQHGVAQRRTNTLPASVVPLLPLEPVPAKAQVTVLVADDSVYIRQSLRQTFERIGYRVIEAHDGMEALEFLTSDQTPDVLMLDIEMPNLNGYDLLNILHSQPGLSECKAILLTSRSSEKHRQRAMELGAYAFLGKPCTEDLLLATVQRALADTSASM
jgi:chemosensory pili system protein ChpA (sensor histidine kinase/response regulator)